MTATLTPEVALREVSGQRVADFSASGAVLDFVAPLDLGEKYTLSAWVSFPTEDAHCVIFRGIDDDFVNVALTGVFGAYIGRKDALYGAAIAPRSGWHHLALSVDGKQSSLYLDGKLYGVIPVPIRDRLATIGNHVELRFRGKMRTKRMDDVSIFNRDLTATEIAALMPVRMPTTKK
jgi:hypothetical protein